MKDLIKKLLENEKLKTRVLSFLMGAVTTALAGAAGVAPDGVKAELCKDVALTQPAITEIKAQPAPLEEK